MSGADFTPIPPEEQFHIDMAQRGDGAMPNAPLPTRPGSDPVAQPAPPAPERTAVAPADGQSSPAVLPPPEPRDGFSLPTPAPPEDPVLEALRRIEQRASQPVQPNTAATAAQPSPIDALLADPNASDEARAIAQYLRQMQEVQQTEIASLKQQLEAREAAEQARAVEAANAELVAQRTALTNVYPGITPQECDLMEQAWLDAANRDPRLVALTYEEAARRFFGPNIESRRVGGRPGPALSIVPPAQQQEHPAGHLASDAAGGTSGQRAPWQPPQDRKPQLEDAKRAAAAALGYSR